MFNSIIGHEKLKPSLIYFVSKKELSGAHLFYGPPSTGKRTIVFEASKKILCLDQKEDECSCDSCRRFENGGHPDFLCVGKDEKIKVADADKILEFTQTMPFLCDYKIVVLDNCDQITWGTSNQLLKIIEEPPKGFLFFLVTNNPSQLSKTTISRCIRHSVGSLSQEDLINILWKKMTIDLTQARTLAWVCTDSSVDIFSQANKYIRCRELASTFVMGLRKDLLNSLYCLDDLYKDDLGVFVDMVILLLTDALLLKSGIEDIMNFDLKKELSKLVEPMNVNALVGAVSIFSQIKKDSVYNININSSIKNALIKSHPLLLA